MFRKDTLGGFTVDNKKRPYLKVKPVVMFIYANILPVAEPESKIIGCNIQPSFIHVFKSIGAIKAYRAQ